MRLIFITLNQLSLESSYLRRIVSQLDYIQDTNKIFILSLANKPDTIKVANRYKKVTFLHKKAVFNGWNLSNLNEVTSYIKDVAREFDPDLIVLTVEVWDLLRELNREIGGIYRFAVVLHATPFVVSPVFVTGDFEKDAINHAKSGIEEYKKDYILNHYDEAAEVLRTTTLIANNNTVGYYLRSYFSDINFFTQIPFTLTKNKYIRSSQPKYDFIYMARIEVGKGVEYLEEIFTNITRLLRRHLRVAVAGSPEDTNSKRSLDTLLSRFASDPLLSIDYFEWVKEEEKESFFGNSSVFIYPSRLDNFPTVVNEALSFGLPVVTWDLPFSRLNYQSTEAVVRVPFHDFKGFANAAVKTLENSDKLSAHAFEYTDTLFLPSEVAKSDLQIFNSIIEASKNE